MLIHQKIDCDIFGILNQITIDSLLAYWSVSEISTNLVVIMNITGSLLLGLIVGYERSYHGRAAGMRTYGLVCIMKLFQFAGDFRGFYA